MTNPLPDFIDINYFFFDKGSVRSSNKIINRKFEKNDLEFFVTDGATE
jgi:hypothetical protein